MYRIDLTAALHETYGERMASVGSLKRFTGERTVAMTLEFMANLVGAGVDMFDVDLGCYDNWWLPHPPTFMPPGCFLEVARVARDYLRHATSVERRLRGARRGGGQARQPRPLRARSAR